VTPAIGAAAAPLERISPRLGPARPLSTGEAERGTLRRVHSADAQTFVGREAELEALRGALAQARSGRGSVWLVQGEPGIGKSRLCEQLSEVADALGFVSLWGRSWEAGGAPAYWPWLQAMRQLARERADVEAVFAARASQLGTMLPELLERLDREPIAPSLEPEQARFQLLDAVSRTLADAADRVPLLLVLEDLHAADASSMALLEFVSKLVRSMRLVILGTARDAEALWSPVGPSLLRVQGHAHVLALPRLSRAQVQAFLSGVLSQGGGAALDAVYTVTEGHPLFVVETARLMASRGGMPSGTLGIPATIKVAIRERLAKLTPETLAVLRAASAFGREVPRAGLVGILEMAPDRLEESLVEASDRYVLVEAAPGTLRFSHILFQEVLLSDLELAERQRLHGSVAHFLARAAETNPPWSALAHHYLRAGVAEREAGIAAAIAAAAEASKQLAYDDAIDWHRAALDALEQAAEVDPLRRCRLLLGLGHARFAAGQVAAAEQTARIAGEVARAAGSPELFAEAALTRAAAFRFAEVDPERVAFLRDALEGLPVGDSGLRARLMARLAAATQPAEDPRGPIELARDAVQMARRVGDPPTLLATVTSAGSALVDLAHPTERSALNREHIVLAEALDQPVEALRGHLRLALDHVQTADLTAARATIDAAVQIAERLQHPHYRWLPALFQAMLDAAAGNFLSWEARLQAAWGLAAHGSDPNAPRTLLMHRIDVLALRGHVDEALALVPELAQQLENSTIWNDFAGSVAVMLHLGAGRPFALEPGAFERQVHRAIRLGDAATFRELASICVCRADTANAETLYAGFESAPFELIHGGMLEVCVKGPKGLPLGRLARLLGRVDQAERHFDAALELATREALEPFVGWAELELAELMEATGKADSRSRERVDRAAEIAERLGLRDLGERARAAADRSDADRSDGRVRPVTPEEPVPVAVGDARGAAPADVPFSLDREGDLWRIRCADASFIVRDSRGMHMLYRLVSEPDREFHALDLVSPLPEITDLGDAGEVLDPRARDAYDRRVQDLRADLAEAEAFGDPGRAARAREEIEFIARELGRAVGKGGRGRRVGSNAERARVNAQRRIRDAIRRIASHHPELGRHLDWAVRTGTFCSYRRRR
jgi:tetratricopeptide (TPR) repeat protein